MNIMQLSTNVISSIEELNEAKSFQFKSFYFAKSRYLKSNLTSRCFHVFSLFAGVLIYNAINVYIILAIFFGYCTVLLYIMLRIHFRWNSVMKTQLDYNNFIHFWLKPRHCLIGLYVSQQRSRNLIGIVGIHRKGSQETCELKRMWIDEAYRGRGSGVTLTNAIFYEARRLRYKKVELTTAENQYEAIRFYQRNNFNFIRKQSFITVLPFNPFYIHHFDRYI